MLGIYMYACKNGMSSRVGAGIGSDGSARAATDSSIGGEIASGGGDVSGLAEPSSSSFESRPRRWVIDNSADSGSL